MATLPSRFQAVALLGSLGFAAGLLGLTGSAAAQPIAPSQARSGVPSMIHPVAVFGTDDREALPQPRAMLAGKIGMLALGEATFCTAFCVGTDTIATASHCLLGTEQTPGPDLERVVFKMGQHEATPAKLAGESRSSIRSHLKSGTPLLRVTPPIAAVRDWAVVRLAKPVCRSGGLPLSKLSRDGIEREAKAGNVYQVAMHRDVAPDALVIAGACLITTSFPQAGAEAIAQDFLDPQSVLMHTCDTGPGSSGSPLLIDGPNGPEVIGINVGTYVLARASASTSSADGAPARASEAIANTAIESERFRSAVEFFTLETSAIPAGSASGKAH